MCKNAGIEYFMSLPVAPPWLLAVRLFLYGSRWGGSVPLGKD